MLKAIARRAVWEGANRREILVRYLTNAAARGLYSLSDATWFLDLHWAQGALIGDIEHALGRLPPEQLQVIQLSFIDGLSHSEIAARLKVPLGTVKSRMRLAFDKLRFSPELREIKV